MKKILIASISLAFLGITGTVHATVGGDTVINSFTYNPADESVYYVEHNLGGKGCPPELWNISLASGVLKNVLSCDENIENPWEKIAATTNGFKPLTPLDLKVNNITIDLSFVRAENYSAEYDEVLTNHFTATIYKDGKKVADIPVQGCSTKQPFMFQGYSIPGFNKKIVLLVSAKGNCFEGGYIDEKLHVVGGFDGLDKNAKSFYKGLSPLLPNEGNYVIFEGGTVPSATTTPVSEMGSTTRNTMLLFAVFICGTLIGFLFKK